MRQYLDLVEHVLEKGKYRPSPHKGQPGSYSVLGYQMRFDLDDGFPLITSRSLKGSWKALVHELLWFLSGSTNVKDLNEHNVHLWDAWATEGTSGAYGWHGGDLGPIYGKQWRAFEGGGSEPYDQIARLVEDLKINPNSRRHMVTTWNPVDADRVFIAPCHGIFKCFVADGELSLHMFQRSGDVPVGIPFNIGSYSLLLMMLAQATGLKTKEFVHTISDTHIYEDQVPAMRELLAREPKSLPRVALNPDVKNIFDFKFEDFELLDYDPHPPIKIPVSV